MNHCDDYGDDSEFMREMRVLYLEGIGDRVAEMGRRMAELRRRPGDPDALADGHRSAHSMAGAAASYGFEFASEVGRRMEAILETVRDGGRTPSERELDVLDEMVAILDGYFREATPDAIPADRPLPEA